MENVKGMTDEAKKELAAKKAAANASWKKRQDEFKEKQDKALKDLQSLVEKSADKNILAALQSYVSLKPVKLVGTREGGARSVVSLSTKFINMMNEKKSVTEDVVFKEFKVGRKECAGFIRKFLKDCEPKNRVWINFTPSDGVYKIIGTGVKAPAEYTGYVPTDDITDLKTPQAAKADTAAMK